jgi:hypothetical protein
MTAVSCSGYKELDRKISVEDISNGGGVIPLHEINGKYGGYGFPSFPSIMPPGNPEMVLRKQRTHRHDS